MAYAPLLFVVPLPPSAQASPSAFALLHRWDSKVEYLFLRLNYPDVPKLRPHLTASTTTAAYCCQCSWKSATDSARVPEGLKWVCTGAHL
jgi:hypothetical protein